MSKRTPKHGHGPVEMLRVPDSEYLGDFMDEIGRFAWRFHEGKRILLVVIPCPGKTQGIWSEWSIDHKNHCGAQWSWDGNEDTPTLTPSLHARGIWHGFVRGGKLIEA